MLDHEILHHFFTEQKGQIVCLTDDPSLFRTVRYSIVSRAQSPDDLVHLFGEPDEATKALEGFHKNKIPFVVFIEQKIEGQKTTDVILSISRLYPAACLIVVGTNITKELSAYYYEIGAKAIISKPVSADAVMKKLALCMTTSKEQHLVSYVRELISDANPIEALEAVDKYLSQNPDSSIAYCLKGDALLSEGDQLEATKAYEHAVGINPYYTEPLKRLVAMYKYTDDDKALELLQRIDSISPFNPDRKLEMAEIHLRKGDKEKATVLLEKGYRQVSQEFSLILGDMAERIAELVSDDIPELAEKYLAKAINKKRAFTLLDLHMFNKLGMIHRNKGEWNEAVKVYKKAQDIAPNDPALYYNMALAYHDGKKRDEVRRCLNRAYELDSDYYRNNEGASYNLGSIYLEYGDKDTAKSYLEHVLELNPDNAKAKDKLERCT